jgi:hypothetical protein
MSVDKMVGGQFEKGLTQMNAVMQRLGRRAADFGAPKGEEIRRTKIAPLLS